MNPLKYRLPCRVGKALCLFTLLLAAPAFLSCKHLSGSSEAPRFQQALDKGVEKYHVRGVSAAIVFDTTHCWTGTSGISYDTVSMKPGMLFSIGSITKNFVAALTLRLAEDGRLSLEDKLSDWLPRYPNVDPDITLRQLLNHTSGIYMFWNNEDLWDALKKEREKVWTPEEVLQYIKEPTFSPGKGWAYSNTNYLLLAMIAQKATGDTLATAFRNYLWKPLHLQNYYLRLADTIPENQAHVFGDNFEPGTPERDLTFLPRASHESITFGSSGIVTTARDLALWGYHLFGGDLLSDASMQEMLQFVRFMPVSNMKGYGLGVQIFRSSVSGRVYAIGHGGGNIGTTAYLVWLPEYRVSIAVMVNAFPTGSVEYFTRKLIRDVVRTMPHRQPQGTI